MIENLIQKAPYLWEIPSDSRSDMNVPAWIYATETLIKHASTDKSLKQLINVTTLPGILERALVMPDVHEGYGFPIGGVAAMDFENGVISPGGIGYDINCGVRLIKTQMNISDLRGNLNLIAKELYKTIPSGVGKGGGIKLTDSDMKNVLENGCNWAVENGFASAEDLEYIESNGCMKGANADCVTQQAKNRGRDQLGTMGAGNHFVEINVVDHVFLKNAANVFGLSEGQVVIQIHTGSRGLGHQVATDYIRNMINSSADFGYVLPDRELSCAPISSKLGKEYFAAMCASANFAWTNRQLITHLARKAWKNVFGDNGGSLDILYDVAHNIAKVEEYEIRGNRKKVMVHRKGATRAFPANHPETPSKYRSVGQPVLIPGSMGTASYVLVGQPSALEFSFGSSCHGAGRMMSRTAALKRIQGCELKETLTKRGIVVETNSLKGLAEEAPDAYKDVESVVDVVDSAKIALKVARLKPLAVIKG